MVGKRVISVEQQKRQDALTFQNVKDDYQCHRTYFGVSLINRTTV